MENKQLTGTGNIGAILYSLHLKKNSDKKKTSFQDYVVKYIRRKDKNVKSIETVYSPVSEVSQKSDNLDQFLKD